MSVSAPSRAPDLWRGVRLWRDDQPADDAIVAWDVEMGPGGEQPSEWFRLSVHGASGGRYELRLAGAGDTPHVQQRFYVFDDGQAARLVDVLAGQLENFEADPRREMTGWWVNAVDATAEAIRAGDDATAGGDGWA